MANGHIALAYTDPDLIRPLHLIVVMPGLDRASIEKDSVFEEDGLPGQARQ